MNAQDIFYIKCVDADNLNPISFFNVTSLSSNKLVISDLQNGIIKLSNLNKGDSIGISSPNYINNKFYRFTKKGEIVAKYNGEKIYIDGDTITIELLLEHNLIMERWEKEDNDYNNIDTTNIETVVDIEPNFQDEAEFSRVLSSKLHFPRHVADKNSQGRVYFSLIIETDGTFSNIQITRSIDEYLDRIALRALRSNDLPKLNPAMKNGIPVRRKITYPINFNLY